MFFQRLLVTLVIIAGGTCLAQSMSGLHVVGNTIHNGDDQVVRLVGMNRQGSEYSCVQSDTIFAGPSDAESVDRMMAWGPINTVRVPINEDCLLGLHGVNESVSGEAYKDAIFNYVNLLNSKGLAAIVDLHWTSNGTHLADGQQPMPNAANSPQAWLELTDLFHNNSMVIFDLFNEPAPDNNAWDSQAGWTCWANGGWCNGISFETVGSQSLVDLVRGRGSQNILMVGGIQYSTSLASWIEYAPSDSLNNIAASLHAYDFNYCRSKGCWDYYLLPVAAKFPIIVGEVGEIDCATEFVQDFLPYAQTHGLNVIAFSYVVGPCEEPSLITDYTGTPSVYGQGYKNYLIALGSGVVLESPVSFPVYTDALSHWVDNWSDGIVNISSQPVVHSGEFSISFWPEVNGQTLHIWCWSCINSSIHDGISFWYNGGSAPFVGLNIQMLKTDQIAKTTTTVGSPVALSSVIEAQSNSWVQGYVKLDQFQVPDGAFDGFWFQVTSQKVVEVYFDDIYVQSIVGSPSSGTTTSGCSLTLSPSFIVAAFALVAFLGITL